MRIATVNVNGVRAAWRKGMADWLVSVDADIVTLQEVRAPDAVIRDVLSDTGFHVAHTESVQKGRNGVAVLTKAEPKDIRPHCADAYFDDSGRWIEVDVPLEDGPPLAGASVPAGGAPRLLTVVSAYVHSGAVGTAQHDDKMRLLGRMLERMAAIAADSDHGVVTGDLNVGHTERDIRNWKGNVGKAGFLPEEREILDRAAAEVGWVDVHRVLSGDVDGPYTWWSMRGQAFDNDTGWRIDYQFATPELAAAATSARVDRAPSWSERWSDHAPLIIDYSL